ncbi:hypothetical protein AVEN_51014-1, partial [Araneus ventricosus]
MFRWFTVPFYQFQ